MRPNWDEYFMSIAILVSSRTSCKYVRAGSVVVLDKRIIGTGYNGAPVGIKDNCLNSGCWREKAGIGYGNNFNAGKCIGIHAEMNALANLSREIHQGATLYTTVFPCPACAKNLLAYNVKRVVYLKEYDKGETKSAMNMFNKADIKIEKLDLSPERLKQIIFDIKVDRFDVFSKDE